MPEFKTLEDIYPWLEGREPYETDMVLARYALRILPMLPPVLYVGSDSVLPLPDSRTVLRPWFVVWWGIPYTEVSEAAKVAFRTDPEPKFRTSSKWGETKVSFTWVADLSYPTTSNVTDPERATIVRVTAKTEVAFTTSTATDKTKIKNKSIEAFQKTGTEINDNHLRDLVDAITADITALEGGTSVTELSAMPLWPDGMVPEKMTALWDNLKSRFPDSDAWGAWTTWYENCLRGARADKELE